MAKKVLTFSGIVCFINDSRISLEEFKTVVHEGTFDEVNGNSVQIFKLDYDNDYLKVCFSDGSAMPRNPNVYNKTKQELEPNPRESDQIEPKDYFAIFDLKTSYLWLSNTKKKSVILDYFQKKFGNKKIVFKDVYEEQKFIDSLKTLDQIKISAAPNIFTQTNSLSQALVDEMYGAHEAVLHLKYQNILVGDTLLEKVKSIFKNRTNFQGVMISGRDEKNLGMLFNNSLFTRKIDIKANVDENEMFDTPDVFTQMISKLEEEANASN
ncbi:hypothetical protein [Myroides sp. DW712]|uniref:hypothetical protein n=1 Tax=Myroides sp. DW712 TaxID=3389800 RepID=UPI0039792C3C